MTSIPNTAQQGRRRLWRVSLGALLAAVASTTATAANATTEPADGSTRADSQFPVTLDQMTGPVTIEAKPIRVVTLGYTDTDIANALGVDIVAAVASPFGDDGVNPYWAATPLSAEVANLDPINPNIEVIAAADPDIILATAAYPTVIDQYDQLSEIAPVVTPITGPLLDSADDLTELIGVVLGEQDAADALIAEADAAIVEFREANPGLEGKTAVFAPREGEQTAIFIDPSAASVDLLAQLGFATPDEVVDLPGDRIFGATFISDEQLAIIDSADVAIIGLYTPDAHDAFLAMPVVANLSIATEGRLIPIERPLGAALQTPNPVSIPYLLEQLGPQLVAAVG